MALSPFPCYTVFSIALVSSFVTLTIANDACAKSIDRMDNIFKETLFIKQGVSFPSNDKEIDRYCGLGKVFNNETKSFINCVKPLPRQVTQILGKSVRRTMKTMCRPGKARQDLATAFNCATSTYHKDMQNCGLVLVNQVYISSLNMTSNQLLPLSCCSFHKLVDCIKSTPVPKCSDEKLNLNDYIMDKINKLLRDLIDLICGRWTTLEECQSTASDVFDYLSKLNNVSSFNSDESLLGALMAITTKLSAEEEENN